MRDTHDSVAVTAMGVNCAIARDTAEMTLALREGRSRFVALPPEEATASVHVVARAAKGDWQERLATVLAGQPLLYRRARKILNNAPEIVRQSTFPALEAFLAADLGDGSQPLERTGLIVAGSNLAHDYIARNHATFALEGRFNPRYALAYSDTHLIGCLSEILALRGPGITVSAASASGNAALFNAARWIRSGVVERCLVVGAATGLSPLEREAFALLGAASPSNDPQNACRPFDAGHTGFVAGEGSAALLLESGAAARERGAPVHGTLAGSSLALDGHHLPDPNVEGETRAMSEALADAGIVPGAVGYLNTHGTGSPLGDRSECSAIRALFGNLPVKVNATKGLLGHCLSAAGVVEAVATLLQLNHGFLHPNRNLEAPIDPSIAFAGCLAQPLEARYALSNGFGFGGFNSCLVLKAHPKGTAP